MAQPSHSASVAQSPFPDVSGVSRRGKTAVADRSVKRCRKPAFTSSGLASDRGTMPIERTDLAQTSIRRKLLAYQAALKARQHVDRFAFHNLRILTVTTSTERLQSMITALNSVTNRIATGRFLFAEHAAVMHGDPLALRSPRTGEPRVEDRHAGSGRP